MMQTHVKQSLPVVCFRAPEGAPLKSKMIYASSKDAIKKKFTGESSCDLLGSEVVMPLMILDYRSFNIRAVMVHVCMLNRHGGV